MVRIPLMFSASKALHRIYFLGMGITLGLVTSSCVVDVPKTGEQTYNCYNDNDCASDYRCEGPQGQCSIVRELGQNCTSAGDCCKRGSICENGVCVESEQNDRTCVEDLGSSSSSSGSSNGGGQTCVQTRNLGDDCSGDPAGTNCCSSGHACVNGTCQAGKANGDSCSASAECASNACADSFCCNTQCVNVCKTCSGQKTSGAAGTCSLYNDGENPNDACGPGNTCQSGSCSGAGCTTIAALGNDCAPSEGTCCEQGSNCENDVCVANDTSGNSLCTGGCGTAAVCVKNGINYFCTPACTNATDDCSDLISTEASNQYCASVGGDDNGTASHVMACVDCDNCNGSDYDCEAQFKNEDFDEWGDAIACQTQNIPNGVRCTADGECMSNLCECSDNQCSALRCRDIGLGACNECAYADGEYCYPLAENAEHAIHCHTDSACDGNNYAAANCQTKDGSICTTDGDCLNNHCECADAACNSASKICAATACPSCTFINAASGNCSGALNNDLADPVHSCGTQTCNGQGACHFANAEDCSEHEECAANFCECADLTCSTKKCSPQACGCQFNADGDTSCEASLENGKEVSGQCENTSACYNGDCKLKTDQSCSANDDCGSGYCECMANDCGGVPTVRQCQDTDCDACGYFDTGTNTCLSLAAGQSHPEAEDCNIGENLACNGTSTGASACKIVSGKDGCSADTDCLSNNCALGRCCTASCNASCETCLENDGGTCTQADFENSATNPCAPYICSGNDLGCTSSCTDDSECADNTLCDAASLSCAAPVAWNFYCEDEDCNATPSMSMSFIPKIKLNDSHHPMVAHSWASQTQRRAYLHEWNDVDTTNPDWDWTYPRDINNDEPLKEDWNTDLPNLMTGTGDRLYLSYQSTPNSSNSKYTFLNFVADGNKPTRTVSVHGVFNLSFVMNGSALALSQEAISTEVPEKPVVAFFTFGNHADYNNNNQEKQLSVLHYDYDTNCSCDVNDNTTSIAYRSCACDPELCNTNTTTGCDDGGACDPDCSTCSCDTTVDVCNTNCPCDDDCKWRFVPKPICAYPGTGCNGDAANEICETNEGENGANCPADCGTTSAASLMYWYYNTCACNTSTGVCDAECECDTSCNYSNLGETKRVSLMPPGMAHSSSGEIILAWNNSDDVVEIAHYADQSPWCWTLNGPIDGASTTTRPSVTYRQEPGKDIPTVAWVDSANGVDDQIKVQYLDDGCVCDVTPDATCTTGCACDADCCSCDSTASCDAGCDCDPDCGCDCDVGSYCEINCFCDADCATSWEDLGENSPTADLDANYTYAGIKMINDPANAGGALLAFRATDDRCHCDVDTSCSAGCACDTDCCSCDTTASCDGGCACDPDCDCSCDVNSSCNSSCFCDPNCIVAQHYAYLKYYHPALDKWFELTGSPYSASDKGLGYDKTTDWTVIVDLDASNERICLAMLEDNDQPNAYGSNKGDTYVSCRDWGTLAACACDQNPGSGCTDQCVCDPEC